MGSTSDDQQSVGPAAEQAPEAARASAATSPPLACDHSAIPASQRTEHHNLSTTLFGNLVREIRELPDGYAFRFDADHYPLLTRFIENERLCCPFFTFGLELPRENDQLWLRLAGGSDVKAFLETELDAVAGL